MIGMQEIQEAQKPSYRHENGQGPQQYSPVRSNADEDEDDDLGEDDVNRALLSSGVRLPKELEEVKTGSPRIWPQIKGIVIEVSRSISCCSVDTQAHVQCAECANALDDNGQSPLYG